MKKLLIVFIVALIVGPMIIPAIAQKYAVDGNGDTVMDTDITIIVGEQFCLDVYLTGTPEPTQPTAGGVWIDYTGAASLVSYASATDAVPPWTAGPTVNEPDGPGTFFSKVSNLSGAQISDGAGTILITTVCFNCLGEGDVTFYLCAGKCDGTGASYWGPRPAYDDAAIPITTLTLVPRSSPGSTTSSLPSVTTTSSADSTSSTTSSPASPRPCLVEQLYGENSMEAALCRYVRDSVLRETPEGREIIKIYSTWSPHLVRTLEEQSVLKDQVKEVLNQILLLIRAQKD